MPDVKWMDEPESHDYTAAEDYLELLYSHTDAYRLTSRLRYVRVVRKKAKDILRAAGLTPLPQGDSEVEAVLQKIRKGHPISPILLVRDEAHGRLIIADGFHRVCAMYSLDDATEVHAHLV